MEQKKHSLNLKQSSNPSEANKNISRINQIKVILAETERWLKLEWVQKKLEKRLAKILKSNSEPFSM